MRVQGLCLGVLLNVFLSSHNGACGMSLAWLRNTWTSDSASEDTDQLTRRDDSAGSCGNPAIRPRVFGRIWGGRVSRPHSWPWMVSLQLEGRHFCGGTLINDRWVLSAAHCQHALNFDLDRVRVLVGAHNIKESETSQVDVAIDEILIHEDHSLTRYAVNLKDVMLLRLAESVVMSDEVSPVCLPESGEELAAGRRCYTTGWGLTEQWRFPETLHQVMVPVIDSVTCNQTSWYDGLLTENMLCAGFSEGERDSCTGDSGGPLVCRRGNQWVLEGVTSWGYECGGAQHPGVYAKVSRFIDWLEEVTGGAV